MTTRADAKVILFADYAHLQRKRPRSVAGPMGVVYSLDACRAKRAGVSPEPARPRRKTAYETRAPRDR